MGLYMYVSEEDRKTKRRVDDIEVNSAFQDALQFDKSLMIEEHKCYRKKWFKNEYVQTQIWWDVYHETPGYDGSAYQARLQLSASGSKEKVIAYLHGIVNGICHTMINKLHGE